MFLLSFSDFLPFCYCIYGKAKSSNGTIATASNVTSRTSTPGVSVNGDDNLLIFASSF